MSYAFELVYAFELIYAFGRISSIDGGRTLRSRDAYVNYEETPFEYVEVNLERPDGDQQSDMDQLAGSSVNSAAAVASKSGDDESLGELSVQELEALVIQ